MPISLRFQVFPPQVPACDAHLYPASQAAARGDWAALPARTSVADMRALGLGIHGTEVALLFGFYAAMPDARTGKSLPPTATQGTALELWCFLSAEAYRVRKRKLSEDEGRQLFAPLYQALVVALPTDGSLIWAGDGMARAVCNAERLVPNLAALQAEGEQRAEAHDAKLVRDCLRAVEEGGETVLQATVLHWESPHDARSEWQEVRRWGTAPTAAELGEAQAKALENPRFFARCQVCRWRCLEAQMWRPDVCQGCAQHWGVVF